MSWFIRCIKNYAVFSGRARRKEYWYFRLFYFLFYAVALTVETFIPFFVTVYSLATIIPAIAVTVRRFHDTGRSGAVPVAANVCWLAAVIASNTGVFTLDLSALVLILIITVSALNIYTFVITLFDSEPGVNAYGYNPKADTSAPRGARCVQCNASLEPNYAMHYSVCLNCREKNAPKRACPNCGSVTDANKSFCTKCGVPLPPVSPNS